MEAESFARQESGPLVCALELRVFKTLNALIVVRGLERLTLSCAHATIAKWAYLAGILMVVF